MPNMVLLIWLKYAENLHPQVQYLNLYKHPRLSSAWPVSMPVNYRSQHIELEWHTLVSLVLFICYMLLGHDTLVCFQLQSVYKFILAVLTNSSHKWTWDPCWHAALSTKNIKNITERNIRKHWPTCLRDLPDCSRYPQSWCCYIYNKGGSLLYMRFYSVKIWFTTSSSVIHMLHSLAPGV